MTERYYSAQPEKGDVYKIIRVEDGKIAVNYCNRGDAVLVLWVLKMTKTRCGMRKLTQSETEAYFAKTASLNMGAGI